MKTAKRILAMVLSLSLATLVFAGCHKKNEIAVEIGEYKYTAGYYSCALINADNEARQKVNEQFTEEDKDTTDIDYFSQKIEDKTYEKWVKDRAIEILKEFAGYKKLCEEKGFKMTDEQIEAAKSAVENSWNPDESNYYYQLYGDGVKDMFESNGVSKDTYLKFTTDSYYKQVYFENVYGRKGTDSVEEIKGTNPVTEDQLKDTLQKNFVLVDRIEIKTTDLEDNEINLKKEKINGYLERLNNGTGFDEIYVEYDLEENSEEEPRDVTPGDGVETPLYPNAILITSEEIANEYQMGTAADYYDELVSMKVGEAKVIEAENTLVLVKKYDILENMYYVNQNDAGLRTIFVGDKADKDAQSKADTMKVVTHKKAIDLFKVKKIKYPEQEA